MDRKFFYLMGAVTLLSFGGGGGLLAFYVPSSTDYYPLVSSRPFVDLIFGLSAGSLWAYIAWKMLNQPFFEKEMYEYSRKLDFKGLKRIDLVVVALCAGFGEEMFFRFFLQPYLGVWLTAIFFVAIHSYLDFRKKIFFYGCFLVLFSVFLGEVCQEISYTAAALIHAQFDYLIFNWLKESNK